MTQVGVATYPELETDLELDPVPSFDVNLYPIPDMGEPPVAASELLSLLAPDFVALGGGSPELVAADPFEYEITRQPLPPSHASGLGTSPLPEGLPVAAWSYLGPQVPLGLEASNAKKAAGAARVDCDVELCHPRSGQRAVAMRAAGCVGLPQSVALEAGRTAAAIEASLRVLEMEPAPVTSVELEVPLQSDVLLQLLDQQMPHPDRLHALGAFSACQSDLALACAPPQPLASPGDAVSTVMPAARPAVAADYQLVSSTDMLRLSGAVLPAQGTLASPGKPSRDFRDCN